MYIFKWWKITFLFILFLGAEGGGGTEKNNTVLATNLDDDSSVKDSSPFYATIDKKSKSSKSMDPIYSNIEQGSITQVDDATEGYNRFDNEGPISDDNPGMTNFPVNFDLEFELLNQKEGGQTTIDTTNSGADKNWKFQTTDIVFFKSI